MKFHIKEVILWPRNVTLEPARLRFTTSALNVISGVSRTGKSAVIPIIDYCLGSETCAIPVNTIRDRCGWFGIIVGTELGDMLIARREPGAQRSTGDMFVMNGASIEPPRQIPGKNATVESVKRSLDELAGLTLLDFAVSGLSSSFTKRPSFRDLMAFTFQPQNIVANQSILFFKADTHEHREKLRTVFPYVLGAISPEILGKQHELAELRKELVRKERELAAVQGVSQRWLSEIKAWFSQARELGLISSAAEYEAPLTSLLDELRAAVLRGQAGAQTTARSVDASVAELVSLQREESERATTIAQARRRLAEMEQLRDTTGQFTEQLFVQRDRLRLSEWLSALHGHDHTCPICGEPMTAEGSSLQPLLLALKELERSAADISSTPVAFDRELQRVRTEVRAATDQLEGVRHRIQALTRASQPARARQDATLQSARFVGRLEQALEQYERLESGSDLVEEVASLKARVEALETELRKGDVVKRTNLALRRVSSLMERIVPTLDAERPKDPVSLSIVDLTVRVAGREREDLLWEIGSGSNWLTYHLAVSIALQQFFLELPHSPVPAFLVIDQPSQVYFPKQLSPAQIKGAAEPYADEDVEAVKRVFAALAQAVRDTQGRLQIIVLDHATDTVWGGVQPINVAGDWRNGAKLVPEGWAEVAGAQREAATVQVALELLSEYVGEYELAPDLSLTVTRGEAGLMTQTTGQPRLEVFAASDTEFFQVLGDTRIVFTRAASGAVDGLLIHRDGREMRARKTK